MTVPGAERLHGLRQPDQRSCGPSSLVAARMLIDPGYRPASFADDVLLLHRRVTSPVALGRAQVPWPRALGTPPWAVATAMRDLTGVRHRTRVTRWGDRVGDVGALRDAAAAGRPVPVYVGDRWLPRHVALVVGAGETTFTVYDPAQGALVETTESGLLDGRVTLTGRWDRWWFVVRP